MRSSGSKWHELVWKDSSFSALWCRSDSYVSHENCLLCSGKHRYDSISPGSTREIVRSIGIADLLKNLSQRSGSLKVHAYAAILLTHLSMPGSKSDFVLTMTVFSCRIQSTFIHLMPPLFGLRNFMESPLWWVPRQKKPSPWQAFKESWTFCLKRKKSSVSLEGAGSNPLWKWFSPGCGKLWAIEFKGLCSPFLFNNTNRIRLSKTFRMVLTNKGGESARTLSALSVRNALGYLCHPVDEVVHAILQKWTFLQ